MKHTFFLFFVSLVLVCCSKDAPNNTADQVGISTVTRFPVFTMTGERYMSIVSGTAYAEPGVTAKEGANTIPVQSSGQVNSSTVGVYVLTYSAVNKDGFPGTITRTVAVLPSAEVPGTNIAGSYQNLGTFTYIAQMERLAAGFYQVNNIWGGASAAIVPSYVITSNGQSIIVPTNSLSPYGRINGTGTLDAAGNMTYTLNLLDQGISGAIKNWKKL
jgi:hypothetical protein